MSCPRSSVPSGCAQDGPASCAAKSISLIGTRQTSGPNKTAKTIASNTTALAIASLCRRNRRQASRLGEKRAFFAGLTAAETPVGASTVSDAGVEPAIEDISDKVEKDHKAGEDEGHRHDHGRVVGKHGRDQQ